MNYVKQAMVSHLKKDWKKNEAILYSFTAIVLFLNDQVYNYQLQLDEAVKKSSLNRQKLKMHNNELKQKVKAYNSKISMIMGGTAELERYADMLSEIEDVCASSLEVYKYQISQYLLDHGIEGEKNLISSLASTINMLCQTSICTIDQHAELFSVLNFDLKGFNMDGIERLSDMIANDSMISKKTESICLNDGTGILQAFNAFTNKLLYSGKVQETIYQ